jgi:hypothetical protein
MRTPLLISLFLLSSTAAFAGPKELAEQLETSSPKACDTAESDLKPVLDKAWKIEGAHDIFVSACNHNPSAPKLFQGSTENAIPRLAKAYCEFRPALRLCMVCRILLKSSADLRAAANDCSGEFAPGERARFNSQVLEIPAETAPVPPADASDAR